MGKWRDKGEGIAPSPHIAHTAQIHTIDIQDNVGRKNKKVNPVRNWRSTPTYCQLHSHVTQKLKQQSNIQPRQGLCIVP